MVNLEVLKGNCLLKIASPSQLLRHTVTKSPGQIFDIDVCKKFVVYYQGGVIGGIEE